MKSRRVSKLLACALAASMCAVPVSADNAPPDGGRLEGNATINTAVVNATFPTALNLKINPLVNSRGTGISVNKEIASAELMIGNSTSDNAGAGVALRCTAVAQATAAADVQLNYSSFTADDESTVKKVYMEMAEATGTAGEATASQNGVFGGGKTSVTKLKSQLQFNIGAPTASKKTVYNGFAIQGNANPMADWKDSDLKVSITYNVKPVKTGSTYRSIPTLAAAAGSTTLASSNSTTTDYAIATDTELSASVMKDAKVTHVQVHSPENVFEDVLMAASDERLKITYTDDTANPEHHKCELSFAKNTTFLNNLAKNQKGKKFDVVVCLDDGRRLISKIAVAK